MTVKTCIIFQKISIFIKWCSFESSTHQRFLKLVTASTKTDNYAENSALYYTNKSQFLIYYKYIAITTYFFITI